jgi:uncharacterized cupredoxin-like copper-binding protein
MLRVSIQLAEGVSMTRRIALASVIATAVAAIAVLVPVASGSSAAKYTVTAVDFKFRNMPRTAAAGRHVFTLVNKGNAKHDLKLAGKKTKVLAKGQRGSITIALAKGKRYAFLCTVPGHAALGMKGTLVVKG